MNNTNISISEVGINQLNGLARGLQMNKGETSMVRPAKSSKENNHEYISILIQELEVEEKVAKVIAKHVDQERYEDYKKMTAEELEEQFWKSESDIKNLKAEVKANPKYVEASEVIKDLNGALRDTLSPYKGTQILRLSLLEQKKG